jgi:hypothetical protein
MNDRLEVPKFASEQEKFLEGARTGRLSNALTVHLSDSDLAAQRGQSEDACAASILHRALEAVTADGIDRH